MLTDSTTNNQSKNDYFINPHGLPVPTPEKIVNTLSGVTSMDQLEGKDNLLTQLFQRTVDAALEAEMEHHLGYSKHQKTTNKNSRNGTNTKQLKTQYGQIDIAIPRDREGSFDPKLIPKHQRTTQGLENKILYLYGLGNSTADISEQLEELYHFQVSPQYISTVTAKILPLVEAWRNRPLEPCYPIVFLDAIRYKIRDESTNLVENKAVYVVLGINLSGKKEILGLYIQKEESAKYWMSVLSDINRRGVKEILICCSDNLTGFNKAIESIYPNTIHQKCVIHQIRNSTQFVSYKDLKAFTSELRKVYTAKDEKQAKTHFSSFKDKWNDKYSYAIKSWENNWTELMSFMQYPSEIRRIIYTTNPIESLNRQLRLSTKKRGSFPNDNALLKCLYLTIQRIDKKQKQTRNWSSIINQLTIVFEDRITQYIDSYMS